MIIDLSYPIHEGMFKYPSDPEIEIERKEASVEEIDEIIYDKRGYSSGASFIEQKYKSGNMHLKMRNHHGTHIDAPSHKIAGGKNIDKYRIEKFINNCVMIDLSSGDLMKRKEREITIEDLNRAYNPRQCDWAGALIFYTGFCDEMKEMEGKLKGEEKRNFEGRFPYFSEEAANYISEKGNYLNIVGIDSFAVDRSGSNSEIHRIFFSKDILPLETLVNLADLKRTLSNFAKFSARSLKEQNLAVLEAANFAERFIQTSLLILISL